jgi:hypothetical protein
VLIGTSGYARSGKDTVANILVGSHGFTRVAFADILRDAVYTLNPFVGPWTDLQSVVDQHGWEYAKTDGPKYQHEEVRRLLQVMGTDVGRRLFGDNVWVDSLFSTLEPEKDYVVSDCRFVNEADAIRARGGQVIRVERPGTAPINGHLSETALDDYGFDHRLINNGTLGDLALAVTAWVDSLQ